MTSFAIRTPKMTIAFDQTQFSVTQHPMGLLTRTSSTIASALMQLSSSQLQEIMGKTRSLHKKGSENFAYWLLGTPEGRVHWAGRDSKARDRNSLLCKLIGSLSQASLVDSQDAWVPNGGRNELFKDSVIRVLVHDEKGFFQAAIDSRKKLYRHLALLINNDELLYDASGDQVSLAFSLLSRPLGRKILMSSPELRRKIIVGKNGLNADLLDQYGMQKSSPAFWLGYLDLDPRYREQFLETTTFFQMLGMLFDAQYNLWFTLACLNDKLVRALSEFLHTQFPGEDKSDHLLQVKDDAFGRRAGALSSDVLADDVVQGVKQYAHRDEGRYLLPKAKNLVEATESSRAVIGKIGDAKPDGLDHRDDHDDINEERSNFSR